MLYLLYDLSWFIFEAFKILKVYDGNNFAIIQKVTLALFFDITFSALIGHAPVLLLRVRFIFFLTLNVFRTWACDVSQTQNDMEILIYYW